MPIAVTPVDISPTADGTYYDVDVSAYVANAGSLAGVILRVVNADTVNPQLFALRCNGSTDDEYYDLHAFCQGDFFIGVDSGDIFEAKLETTDITLTLIAEVPLSEGGSLVNRVIDTGGSDAWADIDISGDTGSDTATIAFLSIVRDNGGVSTATKAGVRCNGSTDDYNTFYPTVSGGQQAGAWAVLDGSEIYEAYNASTSTAEFQLLGWLHTGFTGFVNAQAIHPCNGTVGSYEDCFLAAEASYQVGASSDDAHQVTSGGVVTLNGATTTHNFDATSEWAGMRFTGLAVANGATPPVYLAVWVSTTGGDEPNVTIYCEDVDDATTFTTGVSDISSRALTTATTAWSVANIGASSGGKWCLIDISAPAAEVFARGGWASGNDLNVIVQGSATSTRDLEFTLYDGSASLAPRIYIGSIEEAVCLLGYAANPGTNTAQRWSVRTNGDTADLYYDCRCTAAFVQFTDSGGVVEFKSENAAMWVHAVGYSVAAAPSGGQLKRPNPMQGGLISMGGGLT